MQPGDRLSPCAGTAQLLGVVLRRHGDHLQGDEPLELLVLGLVDHPHPARPSSLRRAVPRRSASPTGGSPKESCGASTAGGGRTDVRARGRGERCSNRGREPPVRAAGGGGAGGGGETVAGRLRPRRRTRLGKRRLGRGRPGPSGDEDEGSLRGGHHRLLGRLGAGATTMPTRSGFFELISLFGASAARELGDERLEGRGEQGAGHQPRRRAAGGDPGSEASQADRLEIPGHLSISGARRVSLPADLVALHRCAGQQLEEDRPEAQDIRAHSSGLAPPSGRERRRTR